MPALEILRLVCGLIVCCVAGAPISTLSVIQPILLDGGVYSEKCEVHYTETTSLSSNTEAANITYIFCEASESAYKQLYTTSLAACAVSILPALLTVRKNGFTVPFLCCALFLAAGSVIVSDNSALNQYIDKYLIGFPLLACAAPFAILNTTASAIRLNLSTPFYALIFVCSRMQPFLFMWLRSISNDIEELMLRYVYAPIALIIATLLLMTMANDSDRFDMPESFIPAVLNNNIFRFVAIWASINTMLQDYSLFTDILKSKFHVAFKFFIDLEVKDFLIDVQFDIDDRILVALQVFVVLASLLLLSLPKAGFILSLLSCFIVNASEYYHLYATLHSAVLLLLFTQYINPSLIPFAYLIVFLLSSTLEQIFLDYNKVTIHHSLIVAQLVVALGFGYFPQRAKQHQDRELLELEVEQALTP